MHISTRAAKFGAFLAISIPLHVHAASIGVMSIELNGQAQGLYHDQIVRFSLDGAIEPGDSVKLRALLNNTLREYYPNALARVVIELNSNGGSFAEGVELMRTFRELGIGTRVTSEASCLSACAIAFLGGTVVNEASMSERFRFVQPGGLLGFHAPSLGIDGDNLVPAALMETSYASALLALGELISESKAFEIDTSLLEVITSTPPDDMYIVEIVDDFARWNIDIETAADWTPDATDVARTCYSYFLWNDGKSALEDPANIREETVENWARNVSVFKPTGDYEFAYVQTLEYEYNEYCIFQIRPYLGIYTTTSTPEATINALLTSNLSLPVVYQLHALPVDFKISDLER